MLTFRSVKNPKSQRSKLSLKLAGAGSNAGERAVYALTGTPLTNRPRDLFPLLKLAGHPLGSSFLSFARRYCDAYENEFGWVTDGASHLDELALQLRSVALRRTKDQVLCLPPKIRTWLPVEVGETERTAEVKEIARLLRDPGGVRQQVVLLATLTRARQQIAAAKVDLTAELVENAIEQVQKVLVYSCFDAPVQRLASRFGGQAVQITGATASSARQERVDRFQNDEGVRVLVANLIAGGVGLNLTAARQVVFNDLDWTPANHFQAEDRAYRIGQTATVNVTYMVARGTLDEFIATVLAAKAALSSAVVDCEALSPAADPNVLGELQRILEALSPRIASVTSEEIDAAIVEEVLASRSRPPVAEGPDGGPGTRGEAVPISRELLLSLARALRGTVSDQYRVESRSRPGVAYDLTAVPGGKIICGCPGFEYRGQCSHARELKKLISGDWPLPAGWKKVA